LKISPKLLWACALAAIFLIAHLAYLPPTLEDLDSMNFALGVRDFDPSKHQPHPPGYPVFIALGKVSHAVWPSEAGSLSLWGAVFGALSVFPLMVLFRSIESLDRSAAGAPNRAPMRGSRAWDPNAAAALGWRVDADRDRRAVLATLVVVTSPLFWFTALRPLSDVPGFGMALAAQACFAAAFVRRRSADHADPAAIAQAGQLIVAGALIAGLAVGVRTQTIWLTIPLLAVVLLDRAGRGAAGALLGSTMTFSIGVLAWAIPLIIASGGLAQYRAAFAGQAAEQFTGLDIFLSNPTPRRMAIGIISTLVGPWAAAPLGWIVVAVAIAGLALLVWRAPLAAALLLVAYVPYAVFHLVVQEAYSRYALPIVPAVGYLLVRGVSAAGPKAAAIGSAAVVIASLLVTLPAVKVYSDYPSPAYAAVDDLRQLVSRTPASVIGAHQRFARVLETRDIGVKVLPSPVMRESTALAAYWHGGGTAPVWYLSDPARGDLELVDPLSRRVHAHYKWMFPREAFISGVRPDILDVVAIDSPPGWFAETGWHLTPETLNISEQQRRYEGVAYVRNRPDAVLIVIGAESTEPGHPNARAPDAGAASGAPAAAALGTPPAGGKPARVSITLADRLLEEFDVPAGGRVFRRIALEAGMLAGDQQFSKLVASYRGSDGRPQNVRLTQLMVASPQSVFHVEHAGWNEVEYSDQMQRRWRWTTARAETFVNSAGRDLTLTLAGESPLRYVDAPPRVTIRAGSQVLATASPSNDFELSVKVPAAALDASDGMLTIETDRSFVPHERSGSADRRTLGLRIFELTIR
jgi:hypothetical protein